MHTATRSILSLRNIAFLFRIFLGCVLIYAGYKKILDPHGFSRDIYNYRLIPHWMVNPAAIVLPWVEVVLGVSLVLGIYIGGASLAVTALMAAFSIAIATSLIRGLDIACGCFGPSRPQETIGLLGLLRDLSLLGMSGFVALFYGGWSTFGSRTSKSRPLPTAPLTPQAHDANEDRHA